jgi:hypothetical protein
MSSPRRRRRARRASRWSRKPASSSASSSCCGASSPCCGEQVGLERGLRDLRRQVVAAQKAVPKLPAIEARLEAKQARLDAEQTRLRHELDATKDKLGKVRVNQSITDYNLSEMRKEAAASKATSIEMELQTSTSRLVMRDIHPAAAKALREFAAQAVADGDTVWFSDPPAGNA